MMPIKALIIRIKKKTQGKSLPFLFERLLFHTKVWSQTQLNVYYKELRSSEQALSKGIRVKLAAEADLDDRYDSQNEKGEAIRKIKWGHLLFIAEKDEKYVFYTFIEKKRIRIPVLGGMEFCIPDDWGYLSLLYVPVKNRKQGIASEAFDHIERHLLENTAIKKLFLVTGYDNASSNRLFNSKGFQLIQRIRFLEVLWLRFCKVIFFGEKKVSKLYFNNLRFLNNVLLLLNDSR